MIDNERGDIYERKISAVIRAVDLIKRLLFLSQQAVKEAFSPEWEDTSDRFICRELAELEPMARTYLAQPEPEPPAPEPTLDKALMDRVANAIYEDRYLWNIFAAMNSTPRDDERQRLCALLLAEVGRSERGKE